MVNIADQWTDGKMEGRVDGWTSVPLLSGLALAQSEDGISTRGYVLVVSCPTAPVMGGELIKFQSYYQ